LRGTKTDDAPSGESAKALGAFYTDTQIAEFLVWWAIRSRHDTVLDPSFGGGVFLRAACKRIAGLGGSAGKQVFGVELDGSVHRKIAGKLHDEFSVRPANLARTDFFRLEGDPLSLVTAVVGNPPFIRYQRFTGEARRRALSCAASLGVALTELSSSWAPFLVHSSAMIAPRGRLAMVIPMEVGYATYARPVLSYLSRAFGEVTFLTFRKKLFPDLSEDTLLLLCEGKGLPFKGFYVRDLDNPGALEGLKKGRSRAIQKRALMNATSMGLGEERLVEYLIPSKARDLYRSIRSGNVAARLGDFADVGIGYVTGANRFFHLSEADAAKWAIPERCLRPAVCRGRAFKGLSFKDDDWRAALAGGDAAFLLSVGDGDALPKRVQTYLEHGMKRGVHKGYKCRMRTPWYRVPNVYEADGFMTYMTGGAVKLVSNLTRAVAPNTLHVVRMKKESNVPLALLAASFCTSLTELSAEVEGHSLGGGMLKLEPKEAEKVLLAVGKTDVCTALAPELNRLLRSGKAKDARDLADSVVLRGQLGLSASDCRLLSSAARALRTRRQHRGSAA
jgi:adenine-specific DNA methylase